MSLVENFTHEMPRLFCLCGEKVTTSCQDWGGGVKWEKRLKLRSDSEETVSRLPKPSAGQSSVGWPGGVTKQSCKCGACGSIQSAGQSWSEREQKTGKQSRAVWMWAGPEQSMDGSCPGLTALLQVPAPLPSVGLTFFAFAARAFSWGRKLPSSPLSQTSLHYLGSLEISFRKNLMFWK